VPSVDGHRVEIAELAHHLGLTPMLAHWHHDAWAHLYESWDLATAEAELLAMDRPGRIPTTWVAFDGPSRDAAHVLGSVSLIDDDELPGFEHLRPWLASLFVSPVARNQGVGRRLTAHVVAQARALGEARVHLFCAGQERYYARLGWRTVARASAQGEPVAVMAIDTDPRTPRRALVTRWCTDPDIATAYSYLRPGGSPADRDRLSVPLRPGLHLAGEVTSRQHPGTMHGAWRSGERAAATVLDEGTTSAVVVGAGLAGLAAARRLREAGVTVTVVEAAGAIGGRCRADTSLGGPVNLGGAWAHGDEGNPIADAASALGIPTTEAVWADAPTFVVGRGRVADERERRLRDLWETIEATLALDAPPDAALGPALRERLATLPDDDRVVVEAWARIEYENLFAAPVDDLSRAHCAEPFALPGADLMLLGSTSAIAHHLAGHVPVRLGVRATAVVADGARWLVVTTDGHFVADAVVVTAPIGALRAGRIHFDPPLPADVLAAIGRVGAGRVAKVFVTFDERWWAPLRSFFVAGDPEPPLATWVDVSDVCGRPALCAFATGDTAERVEGSSEAELCDLALHVLTGARVRP